jgi:hypothetical protein
MVGSLVPMRVGDVEVLVETVPVAGSEPTSGRSDKAGQKMLDAFDRAQETIAAVATRLAGTVGDLTARSVRPDRVEVEFGLSFTAQGNVIVAGSSVAASLKVKVSYDRPVRAAVVPAAQPDRVV